jgi:hypothetical protein
MLRSRPLAKPQSEVGWAKFLPEVHSPCNRARALLTVEIAMMRTPDGHGRLELSRFLTPPAVADHQDQLPVASETESPSLDANVLNLSGA